MSKELTLETEFSAGDQVQSSNFGVGSVILDQGLTVIVRFEHGIEAVEKSALTKTSTPLQAIRQNEWSAPLDVITRIQAEAIQSVNDTWGVFAMSRITLLPHQLWVCKRVLETWPARWLIADDVGLGKTIEAGLILSPLIARGTAKRVLIICPASLVEQWQFRLRTMFDLRFARHAPNADTPRADFWNTHSQVIASLQTLRLDRNGRHDRLFEGDPWDMVIIDEPHHLGADEHSGFTLGYRLVARLVEESRVESMLFFTGTPHRGKNFAFLALLKLLRPDLFDPQKPLRSQLPNLRQVMIRNNKQNVTDLKGNKLFFPPKVSAVTYTYSEAEAYFYEMLTRFILTGKAYASSLNSSNDGRAVILVLITLQKLASSSVAAIRRALKGRLDRTKQSQRQLRTLKATLAEYERTEEWSTGDDEISKLEEQIAQLSAELQLMEDEEPRLKELVAAAEAVTNETKISKILTILKEEFNDQPVLFFTEYKATQSLLMSALIEKYGKDSITFINGDGYAQDVIDDKGQMCTIYENRESAAEKFNSGQAHFLISTEAGGEGIDLQENCYTLIHVDLPWNPMRLHQRVGRLNRYGQKHQVEVISLRNPETVESIIWNKLDQKIENITLALGQVMDDPEDLHQLVLGMTSSSFFRNIFAEAHDVSPDSLSQWFDQETARFGGDDVLETVRNLIGNYSRFDFQQVSDKIPPLDLLALRPFMISMLTLNKRQVRQDGEAISFITPEAWSGEPGVRPRYENMIFDRQNRAKDGISKILGVGHKIIDQAIRQAKVSAVSLTALPEDVLNYPLIVFRINDQVTTSDGPVRAIVTGVEFDLQLSTPERLLKDWQLLEQLNQLTEQRGVKRPKSLIPQYDNVIITKVIQLAKDYMETQFEQLDLPFKVPVVELWAVFWPVTTVADLADSDEEL
jgi:superfamily II DNA or RNA helicase